MKEKILAKRYAQAYVGYASSAMSVERIVEEIKALKAITRDNPEFAEFLLNPEITHTEKCDFMQEVLDDHFSQELGHFLALLLAKRHIGLLDEIADYIRVHYSHAEAMGVLIKTTYPLELDLIQRIEKKLEKKFNRKLNFYLDLDSSLLGGIQVVVGNTIIDGTVRRRLQELRERLNTIRIS